MSSQPQSWIVELEEDPDTGDLLLPFPPDLLESMGWQEGDILNWEVVDNQMILTKVDVQEAKPKS